MSASNVTPLVHPAAAALGRNVFVVASGKGGVGKTWLAVTLSHTMAHLGRRALLFDGDIGLANIDVQLGLMPERDLGGRDLRTLQSQRRGHALRGRRL